MRPTSPRWSISRPPANISPTGRRARTRPRSGPTTLAARGRILLVEDDPALVALLTYHFEREDFEIRSTPDGEDALLIAREGPPDLVILDWMLEGLSGIEVCRRLRRGTETANVPIIMLTARGEEGDRIRGLETGADDYVTKPFSSRERLLDSVWGRDSDIELRTVDVHIRRLRQAINAGGMADIIRTVRSAGYALDLDRQA